MIFSFVRFTLLSLTHSHVSETTTRLQTTKMAALKEFTKEEIAVHNKADDVWMIIDNYVRTLVLVSPRLV